METVRYGLIGSAFVSTIHAESIARVKGAQITAVASPSPGKATEFAGKHGIPNHFSEYRALLESPEVDAVVLGLPNDLHCEVTVAAAQAGKHVICEKPLCTTLEEANKMIAACKAAGVLLIYAEELLFAPKYVRAKNLVDAGAL